MKILRRLAMQILEEGTLVGSVQGVPCLRLTRAPEIEFDFADGHPVSTDRNLGGSFSAIYSELIWILSGSCWIQDLHKRGCHIWDKWDMPYTRSKPEWQRPAGYLGAIYGHQFCNFGATRLKDGSYAQDGFNQLQEVVSQLRNSPENRRIRTTTYNPKDAPNTFIIPCWGDFHFLVENGELWVKNHQRSCDFLVGGVFDLITHSIFFEIIAQCAGLKAAGFTWQIDDLHIYLNQIATLLDLSYPTGEMDFFGQPKYEIDPHLLEWAENPNRRVLGLYPLHAKSQLPEGEKQGNRLEELLNRSWRPLPTIEIQPDITDFAAFGSHDIIIKGYDPHPAIKDLPVLL